MDPFSTLCITQVDNGSIGTLGSTAVVIPNSAITSTYDPITTVWKVCYKVDSFSYFYCHTCNPLGAALPVNISSFTAKRNEAISVLDWVTASEKNNHHFIVQRSKDSKSFEAISSNIPTKAINGNSAMELKYSFNDLNPMNGHNYYRIQQVDIDGHLSHSDVRDVYFGDETMVTLFPNPVNTELNIEINTPKATTAYANIIDATGRNVRTIEMKLTAGANLNKVDMQSLADGVYMIRITNNKGLDYTQTIRKK